MKDDIRLKKANIKISFKNCCKFLINFIFYCKIFLYSNFTK